MTKENNQAAEALLEVAKLEKEQRILEIRLRNLPKTLKEVDAELEEAKGLLGYAMSCESESESKARYATLYELTVEAKEYRKLDHQIKKRCSRINIILGVNPDHDI